MTRHALYVELNAQPGKVPQEISAWGNRATHRALPRPEKALRDTLDALDGQVDDKSFIVGDAYSIADVMWTVILARMEMLDLASEIRGRPRLFAYYETMKRRPSFETARVMPNWKGDI